MRIKFRKILGDGRSVRYEDGREEDELDLNVIVTDPQRYNSDTESTEDEETLLRTPSVPKEYNGD